MTVVRVAIDIFYSTKIKVKRNRDGETHYTMKLNLPTLNNLNCQLSPTGHSAFLRTVMTTLKMLYALDRENVQFGSIPNEGIPNWFASVAFVSAYYHASPAKQFLFIEIMVASDKANIPPDSPRYTDSGYKSLA